MDWLFLRGLSREQRHWGAFPDVFCATNPEARVHCLDLPGTGTEVHRASPATVRAIVSDVRARFLALREQHAGPWGLFGMSLGGMIAMQWCADHPRDFERVVLANTSASDVGQVWDRMRPRAIATTLRALASRDPVARERLILSMVTQRGRDLDEVARAWADIHAQSPVSRATVVRQLRAATLFRAPDRLDLPVLVVAGARDALANPACARALAERFGVPLEVHPEAGHELALDAPEWLAERIAAWAGTAPSAVAGLRLGSLGKGRLPLVIEPAADTSARALGAWLVARRAFVLDKLTEHGAILARGFDVGSAAAFERIARAVEPELKNDYLGTSPRNGLTEYVFSASELPPHYPIPAHCEMSFVAEPPRRLFFCCLEPNEGPGGETPIVDFRKVVKDLEPAVLDRFARLGVRNVRNYDGPRTGRGVDVWKLKRWDEMFRTTDRAVVEQKCRENGLEATWQADDRLRLTNTQPAIKMHPETGEAVWFNHAQVFHPSAAAGEYRRIAERMGPIPYLGLSLVAEAAVRLKAKTQPLDEQAMACTYGDGTPIPDADMDAVREAVWKNMVFFRWRKGDVLILDNHAVAHGRMPYRGPRLVAVAWA
jgi:pimeloyl-ACP methyl ester carboxylesterase/alpha-ketoglutarate-dependent taurine dioxygenase